MKNKIVFGIICVFTISVIVACVCLIINNDKKRLSDATSFRNEYMNYNDKDYLNIFISEDNTFKYKKEKEIIDILNNGSGIIFIGNETDNNSRYMVNILSELAITCSRDIYYINNNSIEDEKLLEIIRDNGIPLVILVQNGELIDLYNGNTLESEEIIKARLSEIVKNVGVEVCTKDGC